MTLLLGRLAFFKSTSTAKELSVSKLKNKHRIVFIAQDYVLLMNERQLFNVLFNKNLSNLYFANVIVRDSSLGLQLIKICYD